jgi:hypothetical protein
MKKVVQCRDKEYKKIKCETIRKNYKIFFCVVTDTLINSKHRMKN